MLALDHRALETEFGVDGGLAGVEAGVAADLKVAGAVARGSAEKALSAMWLPETRHAIGAKDVDAVAVLAGAAAERRDVADAVARDDRAVVGDLPAMDENAAIAAGRHGVAGDLQAGAFDRKQASVSRAGNLAALDAAGHALKGDAVLAAADDAAIVDDELRHAARVDQALRLIADPAVGAVDQQAVEVEQLGLLGQEQMAVAAIDDARRAGHAGKPHTARQVEVGDGIGAGRQEHRHVAVGCRLAACG